MLRLRIYIDKSMVECFLNDRKTVTTRAYPERSDADGLRLFYVGDVTVKSMVVWELDSISDVR